MNGFLSRIVSNHLNPAGNVQPRLKGTFETFSSFQQAAPDGFGETHIESGISNQYNSLNKPNETGNANANLHSIKPKKETAPGNEGFNTKKEIKEEDGQMAEPLNIQPGISNIQSPQQNLPEQEINADAFATRLDAPVTNDILNAPFAIAANDDLSEVVKMKETDEPGKTTTIENLSAKTGENYLLIPDTKIEAGNFSIQQYFSDEEQSGIEHSLTHQKPLNGNKQLNMAIVNAFRLIQNENAAAAANAETEPAQVIKVNIGRIDVRAVTQQTPTARETAKTRPATMSLDDFLKKKNSGK